MASKQRGIETLLNAQNRAWIERRWKWLISEFGADRMTRCEVVQPLARYFPDRFDGSPEDAQKILERVCNYLQLDVGSIEMSFYADRNPVHADNLQQGTAGLYQEDAGKYRIWIEIGNLRDAPSLISTLSHELAHVHLIGHGRISSEEEDHEKLTDLLTVFLGMGVFTANSVIHEQYWEAGVVSGWSIGRRGYLSMPEFGYALALFARDRNESDPDWCKCLRLDVLDAFRKSREYLIDPKDSELELNLETEHESSKVIDEEELDEDGCLEAQITREELLRRLANGERDFDEASFREADLSGMDLRECSFVGADFDRVNLADANLQGCNMTGADIQDAVLLRANLRGACLKDADLTSAFLSAADLTEADIRGADLTNAVLEGAILTGSQRDQTTNLVHTDLTNATIDHDLNQRSLKGKSHVGVLAKSYLRLGDFAAIGLVLSIAAGIGALIGGLAGFMMDSVRGNHQLAITFAVVGATIGAAYAIAKLIRERSATSQ